LQVRILLGSPVTSSPFAALSGMPAALIPIREQHLAARTASLN
jgi:hypothetical protein